MGFSFLPNGSNDHKKIEAHLLDHTWLNSFAPFGNHLIVLCQKFLHMCYCYSLKWRYEFNNTKSGVLGETKTIHYESMKKCEWILGEDTADELYEYKNFGGLKNYIGSFTSNVDDNIENTRNNAGMIFSFHLDLRKVFHLYTSKFEGRHVYSLFYLVLSFSHLCQVYY